MWLKVRSCGQKEWCVLDRQNLPKSPLRGSQNLSGLGLKHHGGYKLPQMCGHFWLIIWLWPCVLSDYRGLFMTWEDASSRVDQFLATSVLCRKLWWIGSLSVLCWIYQCSTLWLWVSDSHRCLCCTFGICLPSLPPSFREIAKQAASFQNSPVDSWIRWLLFLFLTRRENAFPSSVISKVVDVAKGRKLS